MARQTQSRGCDSQGSKRESMFIFCQLEAKRQAMLQPSESCPSDLSANLASRSSRGASEARYQVFKRRSLWEIFQVQATIHMTTDGSQEWGPQLRAGLEHTAQML